MHRHPWWYDKVKLDQLSGGDFISNFSDDAAGEAEYRFQSSEAGQYEFWVRANPIQASLAYALDDSPSTPIDLDKNQIDSMNIAEDNKPDLRFIAWIDVGKVQLTQGENRITFRMDSKLHNHGMLDCFVFTNQPFTPRGTMKPDQMAAANASAAEADKGWFPFDPAPDPFNRNSGFDLRSLNETFAGEHGSITVKDGQFVHSKTGKPERFWAVNGPPADVKDPDELRHCARFLSKYGVNLVRIHGGYFDEQGNVDPAKVQRAIDVVSAMKQEGIYSHFSIYFPLWLQPKPDTAWLKGYDGSKPPFAALYFNPDFQKQYQSWWRALLLTPDKRTGKRLIDEPAVASVELINEDSYFFWTFSQQNIPDPELRILETQFGQWLTTKYGSIDAAMSKWNNQQFERDNIAQGRIGFRPLFSLFTEKSQRDKDTAQFLAQSQRDFYQQTIAFIHGLGFKGLITCSNWTTANNQILGPLERYTYTPGDFLDRHGYFGCDNKGDNAAWSIRDGQTFIDRSALRFDAEEPGAPRSFVHPAMDIHYDDKPSMISETTWCRPNRFRSEAPLFYAVYGALQGSDAIVHFAFDAARWTVKPQFFMQPWSLVSPAMFGQFPAAAMIYRKGLVAEGSVLANIKLNLQDIGDLKGTPLPQDAAFDELRLKDVPQGQTLAPGQVIDPLIHLAGRTSVHFTRDQEPSTFSDLSPYVDHQAQTVTATTGQVKLDFGNGLLTINAPAAQGISGNLHAAGDAHLRDVTIASPLDLGHIIAVSLDDLPISRSKKILLQLMSEEKASGFATDSLGGPSFRIKSIGHDPWLVKNLQGTVRFLRPDAMHLKVTALDFDGYPTPQAGNAAKIQLAPGVIYYLITP